MLVKFWSKTLNGLDNYLSCVQKDASPLLKMPIFYYLDQGCAIFFNSGPNSNKHKILRATPLNKMLFYQVLIMQGVKIKLQ